MNTGTKRVQAKKPVQKTRKQEEQEIEILGGQGGEATVQNSASDQEKVPKTNCAPSFLMEKRGELDPTCEDSPEEKGEEYVQRDQEKEAGGEG